MDKLMMLVLTIGPTIICWKILKSAFTSFASGIGQKMLFGRVPLLGEHKETISKIMPSLAGPISNPDVEPKVTDVVSNGGGKAPKIKVPFVTGETAEPPKTGVKTNPEATKSKDGEGARVGVAVGPVNAAGTMPQRGMTKDLRRIDNNRSYTTKWKDL